MVGRTTRFRGRDLTRTLCGSAGKVAPDMDSGRPTRRRRSSRRPREAGLGARSAYSLVPIGVVAVTLGLLLQPAINSPLIAVLVIGALVLLGLIAALGFDRTSTVLLVMAFGFAPLTNFAVGPKPFVLASVMFFASFALALPRISHIPLRLPGKFMIGGVLLTVTGFIATLFATNVIEHLIFLMTAVVGLIVMPAMVAWMSPSTKVMYACVIAFGIGTSFSTVYGLQGFFYRNYGFTYHPVALAYTCMLALSFVPFIIAAKGRGRWLFLPPIVALALVGTWTSGSRTGLLVIAALAVLVPILERSVKIGLAVLTAFVALVPSLLSVDTGRNATGALNRLFGGGGATASDSTRLMTIQDGFRQIQENPIFGNGYTVDKTYVIHNIYLQVLQAQGLIALVGLLLIFTAFVAPLRRASAPQRALAYPAYAAIIAGPFQPNMGDHYLALSLGLAMTAVVNVLNNERRAAQAMSDAVPYGAMPQTRV